MGLTDQQKLYVLPEYYLLMMLGDDEICGLINRENAKKINAEDLQDCGFYLKRIKLDELYTQGLNIIKDEDLI